MKTFLWCDSIIPALEYEFIAVNAENLEHATHLATIEIEAERVRDVQRKIEFYKGRIEERCQPEGIEKYCRKEADERLKALRDEPIVLELGQARIISHSNA